VACPWACLGIDVGLAEPDPLGLHLREAPVSLQVARARPCRHDRFSLPGRPARVFQTRMSRTAKYGYDVAGGTIGITAARSPVFAWHDSGMLDEETAHLSGPGSTAVPRGRAAPRRADTNSGGPIPTGTLTSHSIRRVPASD
jgi:hypothetical protein